jgi:pimeloyl-ACP methyl ester carboxylesterase
MELGFRAVKQPAVAFIMNAHAKAARDTDWKKWEQDLRTVAIPTTILQSSEDRVFSLDSARYLQSLIPSANFVEVEGSGHAMVFDQPRRICEVVMNLNDLSGSADEHLQENLRGRQGA